MCYRKYEIVRLSLSWHGMTAAASACIYRTGRTGHGPMTLGSLVFPAPNAYENILRHPDGSYHWKTELEDGWSLVDAQIAAVVLEPVMSSGGMLILPEGYLEEVKQQREKRDILLTVDETQRGIGRCGCMFVCDRQ